MPDRESIEHCHDTFRRPSHQRARHPRTAIGLTENKHLILLVVDGRQTNRSGFSARELTRFMVKWFNPQYALNLDGGGSRLCHE